MKLTGRTIVEARAMTPDEMEAEGWGRAALGQAVPAPLVLVLDDGSMLFASTDAHGSAPAALLGVDLPHALLVHLTPDNVS